MSSTGLNSNLINLDYSFSSKALNDRAPKTAKSATRVHIAHRPIIMSSDEASEPEIIEISDDSLENIFPPRPNISKTKNPSFDDDANLPTTPNRPFVDESIIIL